MLSTNFLKRKSLALMSIAITKTPVSVHLCGGGGTGGQTTRRKTRDDYVWYKTKDLSRRRRRRRGFQTHHPRERKRGLTTSGSLTVWSSSVTSKTLRGSCCGSYTINGSQDLSAKSQSNIPSKKKNNNNNKSSNNNLSSLMMMMMKSDSSCCLGNHLQKKKMVMMMDSGGGGGGCSRVPSFFTKHHTHKA